MTPNARLGPLERAIEARDGELLIDTIRKRCRLVATPAGTCWIWTGAKRTNGYPYMGRMRTSRLTHRVVAWAASGCVGSIADLPDIHHACGITLCVCPEHLVPTTALINSIERSTRNALLYRIAELTTAVQILGPGHPLLGTGWDATDSGQVIEMRAGKKFQSARMQLRQLESNVALDYRRQQNQVRRFQQVIEVDALVARGCTKVAALAEIGIDRTAYYEWRSRMREAFGRRPEEFLVSGTSMSRSLIEG